MSTVLNQLQISLDLAVSGLKNPVAVTNAGDERLFVAEQSGKVRIVQNGQLLATPYLEITNRVKSGGEQGLLGMAFSPNPQTGDLYVNYTNLNGDTVIARYSVSGDPNRAELSSEEILLTIPQPFANHNGGSLAFGKDGFLYIGTGDGGSGGDPQNNAQNPGSLLGKLLRIDVESGATTGRLPYAIPSSNPFLAATDPTDQYRDEIWGLGLRNPWRLSFDRQTGDLYLGDVGQNAVEEVNFQAATSLGGENYGWRRLEGSQPFNNPSGSTAGLVLPVAEYDHSQGQSVTGGFVYRGDNPALQGVYLYGDFVTGRIWGLRQSGDGTWENALLLDSPYNISTFGEDQTGGLYLADYASGQIYRISAPIPPSDPSNSTITGTAGRDRLRGTAGDDIIAGLAGHDLLLGRGGSDQLLGGAGRDQLFGGAGTDRLMGGEGSDQLTGGGGSDIFRLEAGSGRDQILDFRNGQDQLQLLGRLQFEDLQFSRLGSSTLIRVGSDRLAVISRVRPAQLDRSDFVEVTTAVTTETMTA
ncbi:MAG: PQQ-dependent sugar dehydrogenase [Pegethrix bostrychoides GSE-TBD4-15B]|jgi:glucose/arabinose dehydrogenase|uniref:PQQ-dependent sugar dehydrogenase n=1 Tax=Pegethrix bostrychoides GSE-TBD4-15B TaxID=2839662 RepID=A0A951U7D0_9CYAN|nr:PQQ-dependent sugar dehydrogenase [Pegethrix bostrychoides GSE-TBD4-15B]